MSYLKLKRMYVYAITDYDNDQLMKTHMYVLIPSIFNFDPICPIHISFQRI